MRCSYVLAQLLLLAVRVIVRRLGCVPDCCLGSPHDVCFMSYMYLCIYIYRERDRERERDTYMCVYIYIYICIV